MGEWEFTDFIEPIVWGCCLYVWFYFIKDCVHDLQLLCKIIKRKIKAREKLKAKQKKKTTNKK